MSEYFSDAAIQRAIHLKASGLPWEPKPGHYVYDATGVLPHTSPFQERVFFILDIAHFVRYCGDLESLKAKMVWLPTWLDCFAILEAHAISRSKIADHLAAKNAIRDRMELETLYELIQKKLRTID